MILLVADFPWYIYRTTIRQITLCAGKVDMLLLQGIHLLDSSSNSDGLRLPQTFIALPEVLHNVPFQTLV